MRSVRTTKEANMSNLDFNRPDLAKQIEKLPVGELDQLPYGVIKLDADGVTRVFNATEARMSGFKSRPALGLEFFLKVAPCMGTPEFRGRIEQARQTGNIDIEMGWVGDFDDMDREMQVRIQSASDNGIWIFIYREAE
jgi:photoactive yellow protein